MLISLDQFRGMLPRYGIRNLPKQNAESAWDAKTWSTELRCIREDKETLRLANLPDGEFYQVLFRYDVGSTYRWLAWDSAVNVTKGPVAGDTYNRMFITGLDKPRAFDSTMLPVSGHTVSSTDAILLGVSAPSKPTLSVSGTAGGNPVSRTYVITYVREWADSKQDESAPSDVATTAAGSTTVDVEDGQVVLVSDVRPPTATEEGDIKYVRVYRSLVTTAGVGSYKFVYEFSTDPSEVASYPDVSWNGTSFTFTDDVLDVDLAEELLTMDWATPPEDLLGLVSLRNGVLAGFSGNKICFSEPNYPHAWPVKYQHTLDYNIVGLGSFGNNLVVCTDAYPHMINVTTPDAAIPQPLNELAPCVSKRSIVSTNGAVMYATPQGVISIDTATPRLITQDYFTPDEWSALNPATFAAAHHQGRYVAFGNTTDGSSSGVVIEISEQVNGVVYLSGSATALYVHRATEDLYMVKRMSSTEHAVVEFEGEPFLNKTAIWKSKEFVTDGGITSFSAARVDLIGSTAELLDIDTTSNLMGAFGAHMTGTMTFGGDIYTSLTSRVSGTNTTTFKLYADGELVYQTLVTSDRPFRLPSGYRCRTYQIGLETTQHIRQVDLATSMSELA